jgi:hypothetical protein
MNLETAIEGWLLYFVLPTWVIAGAADGLCHKQAHIELTAGPLESVIHLLMLAEVGAAVLAALFLEINGGILIFLFSMWLLHEVTSYWDLHYASSRRDVAPWEQRVHDYLAVLPLLALVLVSLLNWSQFLAIFGLGPQPLDASIRLKADPLSPIYLVLLLGAIFCFNILPYVFELVRGLTAAGRTPAKNSERKPPGVVSQT